MIKRTNYFKRECHCMVENGVKSVIMFALGQLLLVVNISVALKKIQQKTVTSRGVMKRTICLKKHSNCMVLNGLKSVSILVLGQ